MSSYSSLSLPPLNSHFAEINQLNTSISIVWDELIHSFYQSLVLLAWDCACCLFQPGSRTLRPPAANSSARTSAWSRCRCFDSWSSSSCSSGAEASGWISFHGTWLRFSTPLGRLALGRWSRSLQWCTSAWTCGFLCSRWRLEVPRRAAPACWPVWSNSACWLLVFCPSASSAPPSRDLSRRVVRTRWPSASAPRLSLSHLSLTLLLP